MYIRHKYLDIEPHRYVAGHKIGNNSFKSFKQLACQSML